ncbi:hypothetical protein Ahy_B06g080553 isoform B [Arachis hypogaea]|uniref:Serine aminopeptidase S33 domain-containing protein n=1 Tax=Arachis hypogaea TaxID=3818 RepID=A0A444YIA7_ARAHY|nr:hypothetical protein Ahy_B06g080553 isoform B [Arachis hypogaea]
MDLEFEYQEEYWRNSRGMQLFTCKWLPLSSPKALVFLCHGYGMECSRFMRECGVRLACARYAVYGVDYEGHGKSQGARCYIKKFDNIVHDCFDFFSSVTGLEEYRGKPRFLYGESMGGAVALLLHMKHHSFWDGAVLVAPMCKIRKNKLIYQERPRLKTALEMLRTSMSIEESLYKVTLPFFVLHGEADTVTDPDVSGALYERASSKDKTIKLYPSMWHGLTSGEPDDNIDIVFDDIITWLDTHNTNNLASSHSTLQPCATTANKTTTTSSVLHKTHIKRRRSYLCGLKRRNSLHHSAT